MPVHRRNRPRPLTWTYRLSNAHTSPCAPESFTGTELDFAVEICNAVAGEWGASAEQPMIINLPSTVEMATPNVYADQVEWLYWQILSRPPDEAEMTLALDLVKASAGDREVQGLQAILAHDRAGVRGGPHRHVTAS